MGRTCVQHPMPGHALGLLLHTPMANALDAGRCCRPVISAGGSIRWGYYLGTVTVMSALPRMNATKNALGWALARYNVLRVMQPYPQNLTETRITNGTNDVALANILLAANVDREVLYICMYIYI